MRYPSDAKPGKDSVKAMAREHEAALEAATKADTFPRDIHDPKNGADEPALTPAPPR